MDSASIFQLTLVPPYEEVDKVVEAIPKRKRTIESMVGKIKKGES